MLGADFSTIEADVVKVAAMSSVRELSGCVDLLIQQYQPDASDDKTTEATLKRKLHLSVSLDGWWHLTGLLDPETGERIRAALDVYADPTAAEDDPNRRDAPRRCPGRDRRQSCRRHRQPLRIAA
ncbi:MAG: DUF222 domain-containing protein [Candidatus Nanopelagicales bacterium]